MSFDIALLILRIAIALALYAFLTLVFTYIWQDVRNANAEEKQRQRSPAKLVVTSSDGIAIEIGQTFPLQPFTTLGRGPTNLIVLPDTFASVNHAQVVCRRDQWWLEDQQSRNGTTLNGVTVKGSVVLLAGDEIGIGRVKFRFELD